MQWLVIFPTEKFLLPHPVFSAIKIKKIADFQDFTVIFLNNKEETKANSLLLYFCTVCVW